MSAPRGVASTSGRFRGEIEQAVAHGASPDDLLLRLTLGDASRLLRDPDIATDDIRFEAGVMSFLGVQVRRGGVAASALERAVGSEA
ncbi:MAG TPA: hypothetical protein VG939_21335 [Caulobacteraceae bacterium]|nr:hypothetical protein [Caulobacteraceae bacterium]